MQVSGDIVMDAIDAFRAEANAWSQHVWQGHTSVLVEDSKRGLNSPITPTISEETRTSSFRRQYFDNRNDAEEFIFFECMNAAVSAVLKDK